MTNEEIIQTIKAHMVGHVFDQAGCLNNLLEIIELAGEGNYLEIGVLHGGSLCAASLKKQELGHAGICYGIDPLNGFYMQHKTHRNLCEPNTQLPINPEIVHGNLKRFGLKNVKIIQSSSYPFPIKGRFSCVYIDGDHWGEGPRRDWQSVKDISNWVIFHDYDEKHPDIKRTCHEAEQDPNWERYSLNGISFTLKRKVVL